MILIIIGMLEKTDTVIVGIKLMLLMVYMEHKLMIDEFLVEKGILMKVQKIIRL